MSKAISVKLKDEVFEEAEQVINTIHIPRNAYINNAIDFYTKIQKRKLLKKQLEKESIMVAKDSIDILNEFQILEGEILE